MAHLELVKTVLKLKETSLLGGSSTRVAVVVMSSKNVDVDPTNIIRDETQRLLILKRVHHSIFLCTEPLSPPGRMVFAEDPCHACLCVPVFSLTNLALWCGRYCLREIHLYCLCSRTRSGQGPCYGGDIVMQG